METNTKVANINCDLASEKGPSVHSTTLWLLCSKVVQVIISE